MKPIELEIWRPKENDPRYVERVGTRSAEEVFKELEQRLDSMGMLPDEYFLLDRDWQDGRLIPKDADIFVTTDYGESEGVYLDGYLKWYEDGKPVTKSFFTGKTLGETGADMDRMFLISSAITKAFHGYGRQPDNGMVLYLSAEEKKEIIDALVEKRERTLDQADRVEKLLRHAAGSITAYMDTVGERPLRISDFDKAVLAIRDGELEAFKELLPKVSDHADELLVETAGRTGNVGRKMSVCLLAEVEQFTDEAYLTASQRAVDIGDTGRVRFLMEQYENHAAEPRAEYYGEVIDYACGENKAMGHELIAIAPNEWIAAAPTSLHIRMSGGGELIMSQMLISKGLQPGADAPTVLQNYTCSPDRFWMAEQLLKNGMEVRRNDYLSLDICMRNGAADAAKLLLDQGVDFEQYQAWAEKHSHSTIDERTLVEVQQHWNDILSQQQEVAEAPIQGMTMGGLSQ
ncbi:MAG: ankyrin repeat domain-containing protein [Ruminococcaceae bacterium]|nr:ankyrin repeat domain-containing protein [Oscillospiraceae bacterium]